MKHAPGKTLHQAFVFALIVFAMIALACGCKSYTQKKKAKIAKIVRDRTIPDEQAIDKIAHVIWAKGMYTHKIAVTKKPNGRFLLRVTATKKSTKTVLSQKYFRSITFSFMARAMWRMFRAGMKRNLDEIVLSERLTLRARTGERPVVEVFRVRMTLDRLKTIPGWESADPYRVDRHGLLRWKGKKITKKFPKVWQLELDDSHHVLIRKR